ncbi:hypothetical protein M9458_029791, partial [Cirrhinus mrigala]
IMDSGQGEENGNEDTLLEILMILEQLVSLQQQQIQLIEQLRLRVDMITPQIFQSTLYDAVDPPKALGAHLSQQLSSAAALNDKWTDTHNLSSEADQCKNSSDVLAGLHRINGNGLHGENGSGAAQHQQMVDGLVKKRKYPNECVVCHEVLSCQGSLEVHYRSHILVPRKCKICGRAVSTKGKLEAHLANNPLPENQFESPKALDASMEEDKNIDSTGHEERMEKQDLDLDNQEMLNNSTEPQPYAKEDQAFQ